MTDKKLEQLKRKMRKLSERLTVTLELGEHFILKDEAWERWAKVVDEYERLGGFKEART